MYACVRACTHTCYGLRKVNLLGLVEEPAVVELRDGRLLCFGRTKMGCVYQSFSEDQGASWGPAEPTVLASSYSPASIRTVPKTGDILCVWNQVSGQEVADGMAQSRMSLAVSEEAGKRWNHFKNLESLDDAGTKIFEIDISSGEKPLDFHLC